MTATALQVASVRSRRRKPALIHVDSGPDHRRAVRSATEPKSGAVGVPTDRLWRRPATAGRPVRDDAEVATSDVNVKGVSQQWHPPPVQPQQQQNVKPPSQASTQAGLREALQQQRLR